MNQHSTVSTYAPDWVICDSQSDEEDVWHEQTDPLNERDELCTACFDHAIGWGQDHRHNDIHVTVPTLVGLVVYGTNYICYLDRKYAEEKIGLPAIERIEEAQFNHVNGV